MNQRQNFPGGVVLVSLFMFVAIVLLTASIVNGQTANPSSVARNIWDSFAEQNKPDDGPQPGDKCPSCNGRGKSGDGISTCTACNGTGKYQAMSSAPSVSDEEFEAKLAEMQSELDGVKMQTREAFAKIGDLEKSVIVPEEWLRELKEAYERQKNEEDGEVLDQMLEDATLRNEAIDFDSPLEELEAEQTKPTATSNPSKLIIIHTAEGCEPCKRWLRDEKEIYESHGWTVEESRDGFPAPWYEIFQNGKRWRYPERPGEYDFMTVREFNKVRGITRKR